MTSRFVKRVVVGIVGGTVLLVGLAMVVLPGPAMVVIPAGLAILATEFVWARKWLRRAKETATTAASKTGLFNFSKNKCGKRESGSSDAVS
ncbi:MAG: PGPGW domain-containing protein [Verrucomicrobiae bacterium]|nr:PGPGW domain-containing protein [Verrucomicrobiae bacterium]